MRFEVPQFIDTEDKIFGPLSFKEFTYLAGGAGLSYILYRYIPNFYVALLFILPVLGFAGALAFYRPNNKPFIDMVQSALIFAFGEKLFIWRKERKLLQEGDQKISMKDGQFSLPIKTSEGKLDSLGRTVSLEETRKTKSASESLNLKI